MWKTISVQQGGTCDAFARLNDWNWIYNDITVVSNITSYEDCCSVCQRTSGCVAFSYHTISLDCWPKYSFSDGGYVFSSMISAHLCKFDRLS